MIMDETPVRHHQTAWLAVRCCCTPTKVLGFLRVPDKSATFLHILDRNGAEHSLHIRPISEARNFKDLRELRTERAIYSEERSIEFWRKIPDFVEARDA